jgi:integrase/recombinase XerC
MRVISAGGSGLRQPSLDARSALAQLFGGVRPLRLEEALFEAMLEAWRARQVSRNLKAKTVRDNLRLVRRFQEHAEVWPWEWRPLHAEEWIADLASAPHDCKVPTLRGYQASVAGFVDLICDPAYPFVGICEAEFGMAPMRILTEENRILHVDGYEGDPARRPLSREELQAFFDCCDAQVTRIRSRGRKGALAAFRDAALFKTAYAFGLRRAEVSGLDVVDVSRNPRRPEFADFGQVTVRYGKSKRGGQPRRRTIANVFEWLPAILEQYLTEIRPRFGFDERAALWLSERGGRVAPKYLSERFAELRDLTGLDRKLTLHCLRHSYLTHLAEDRFPALFIQLQAGHSHQGTTAIYTHVSDEFRNAILAEVLADQLAAAARVGTTTAGRGG